MNLFRCALSCLAALNLFQVAHSQACEVDRYVLNIQYLTGNTDGVTRRVIGVNGGYAWDQVIRSKEGHTLSILVVNNLNLPTAIHWHGLYHNSTSFFDGSSRVTQCPIPPGGNMTYQFKLSQHGTYWWHTHHGSQYVDGIRGPLIIDSGAPVEEYVYDDERIIQLSDWYHSQAEDLLKEFMKPGVAGIEPIPDSVLVTGRGRYDCNNIKKSSGLLCSSNPPRTVVSVLPQQTYRLRLINTAAFGAFNFSIDNHMLTVIEVDGVMVNPMTVNRILLNVAQRYSVLVQTNQLSAVPYWIRSTMNHLAPWFAAPDPEGLNIDGLAIFQYTNVTTQLKVNSTVNSTLRDPVSLPFTNYLDLDDTKLQPLYDPQYAPKPDVTVKFSFSMEADDKSNITFAQISLNDRDSSAFSFNNDPLIGSVLQGKYLPPNNLPIYVNTSKVVELVIWNNDLGEHPFHLHGHSFWVIAKGYGKLPSREQLDKVERPSRRDTFTIEACLPDSKDPTSCDDKNPGYTVIRFVANNPGVWMFHCHIDWHMQSGLAMVFVVQGNVMREIGLPLEMKQMCNIA